MPPKTVAERFWEKVDCGGGPDCCWPWLGATSEGYGSFWLDGSMVKAHRFAYEQLASSIPDGLCIDHLCRNRACVNPAHMEAVTGAENTRRGERSAIDLTGQRFGLLVVVGRGGSNRYGKARWVCKCDCGREAVVLSGDLRRSDRRATRSCGCQQRAATSRANSKGSREVDLEPIFADWCERELAADGPVVEERRLP